MAEIQPKDLNFLTGGPSAKNLDDPAQNPDHLANIAAGAKRDEERARRQGFLEEEAEKTENFSIDPRQLEIENELAQFMEPGTGDVPIENADPAMHYWWSHLCCKNDCKADTLYHNAITRGIRSRSTGRVICGRLVAGPKEKNPVAENFIGHDCAAGTSHRGFGDCQLYEMPIEDWEIFNAVQQQRARRALLNGAEMLFEDSGLRYENVPQVGGNPAHGRRSDQLLRRTILSGSRGQTVKFLANLKAGTVAGLKPGAEA
jgi:hypothetical protein